MIHNDSKPALVLAKSIEFSFFLSSFADRIFLITTKYITHWLKKARNKNVHSIAITIWLPKDLKDSALATINEVWFIDGVVRGLVEVDTSMAES